MSKVSMFGKFTCLEGKHAEMDAAIAGVVAAIEPWEGTEAYSYHRGNDGTYLFFAVFSDMEAMKNHGQTDAMKAAMPAFHALLAGPPEISMAVPL
jgi:quinol monooxygenase YgiN